MSLKADLHVHSMHSKRPSEWLLRKIGCAESYTNPLALYRLAHERGMGLVTITDHNSISGALDIAHHKDVFVSEEITAYFPEDRCKFHVLAWNISEKQHEEITNLRESIFELVPYLNREGIVHALAHPFYAVNERLTPEHLDRALLLFKNFELNGSRDDYQNGLLREILENLTPKDIEFLADKYDLAPVGYAPWIKNFTRGSDDHSSVRVYDNLDFLFRGCSDSKHLLDDFLRQDTIEMETLTHIRGRSIPNQFILCDEAAVNKNIYRSQRNSSLTQF